MFKYNSSTGWQLTKTVNTSYKHLSEIENKIRTSQLWNTSKLQRESYVRGDILRFIAFDAVGSGGITVKSDGRSELSKDGYVGIDRACDVRKKVFEQISLSFLANRHRSTGIQHQPAFRYVAGRTTTR